MISSVMLILASCIQENIVTISKQRARLAALESQAQVVGPPQKPLG